MTDNEKLELSEDKNEEKSLESDDSSRTMYLSLSDTEEITQTKEEKSLSATVPITVIPEHEAVQGQLSQKKKDTSKIPLEAVLGQSDVKAARPMETPTIRLQRPQVSGVEGISGIDEQKKKTSRISLEAALAPDQVKGAVPPSPTISETLVPKTIRLRRPSEMPTVKAAGLASPLAETSRIPDLASLHQTVPLKEPAVTPKVEEEESATRKRTIKLKRPTVGPTVTPPGELAKAQAGVAAIVVKKEDMPGPVLLVTTVVMTILILVTIYMFLSQTIGPNICLTETSYYKEGPNLAWPGKIEP